MGDRDAPDRTKAVDPTLIGNVVGFPSRAIFLIGTLTLLGGCRGEEGRSAGTERPSPAPSLPPRSQAVRAVPARRVSGAGDRIVVGLAGTTLDERTRNALRAGEIAGIILLPQNLHSIEQVRRLTEDARRAARSGGRPTPILGIDQEGGRVDRLRKLPGIPVQRSAARMAKLGAPAIERDAARVGRALASLGLNVNFAPVADLATPGGIVGDRAYGKDPRLVASYVRAAIRGYRSAGIRTVVKHYPGHGLTRRDSHRTLPRVSASKPMLARHASVFRLVRAAAPDGVMLGHLVVPSVDRRPASLSLATITRLKKTVGERSVTFTDSGAMTALASFGDETTRAAFALTAGVDVYLTTTPLSRLPRGFGSALARRVSPSIRNDRASARVREWRRTLAERAGIAREP